MNNELFDALLDLSHLIHVYFDFPRKDGSALEYELRNSIYNYCNKIEKLLKE